MDDALESFVPLTFRRRGGNGGGCFFRQDGHLFHRSGFECARGRVDMILNQLCQFPT